MNFLKWLFKKKKKEEMTSDKNFSQEQYDEDYDLKTIGLESILGKMHNLVGHAIIPFEIGGAVDMYYFPNHIEGTGFATMELLDPDGNGPLPNALGTYELVAFTKEPYNNSDDDKTLFNLIERRICGIFTTIGNYSSGAVLKQGDTCELPEDGEENKYLIFDNYTTGKTEFKIGERTHHLLLCMEIFKSEMLFLRANGSDKLFELLKQAGHYPYSDLNRQPIA